MQTRESAESINLPSILEVAIAAARSAGAMLREEFHKPSGRRGQGQVAAIDLEVEHLLKQQLLSALPCRWLGEEAGFGGTPSRYVWVVDPHDGTGAFLQGRRGSSVSVALLRDAKPILGVVYAFGYPDDEGDLISWAEDAGAVRRNGAAVDVLLVGRELTKDAVVALSYVASQSPHENATAVAPARFVAVPSTAYRLALAACGEAVAAVALNPLSSWDFAAGHALLIGAGGILIDSAGNKIEYDVQGRARSELCFGGASAAVTQLVDRDWSQVMRPDPGDPRPAEPRKRVQDSSRLSRAQGCLLGQVAGDALGALVEFQGKGAIASSYPKGLHELADGGPWSIIAGQPTDDSELALALARCLTQNRRFERSMVLEAYRKWYRSSPFDVGGTTRAALALGQLNQNSQANGSLMRVSPIGVFASGNPKHAAELAADDSCLTHPHPVCLAACSAFAAAISVGVGGGTREDMFDAALAYAGGSDQADLVRDILRRATSSKPADYETSIGWVLIALQNAFYHLCGGTSVADAIATTVSEGGDTDTNGAIAGALVGAAEGRQGISDQWRRMILSCRPMELGGAAEPRPMEYWPDDLLELAEGLLDAGADR
ncbi:inositol monophosphatase family protein [Devosia sp. RR2S18]|uniref:inositol monophosphatase family protein n=1 Tax=Devosia rhizosphaerae TaxID=3049774 RepID=UPI0025413AE2|nr:inositol monophosphatase family protein [Devosia sp. RR2S18]WIJ25783.1 inositol monophosphatase family protein [Devosia sp. RR2S18]